MYIVTEGYPDGIIGWMDVTTLDVAGAKAFYGGLFGWDFEELTDPEGNIIYHQALIDGYRVVGMGDGNGQLPPGTPAFWTPYVIHSDVNGVVARAVAGGASVVFPPMDIYGTGHMAIIEDASGVLTGVWQPGTHTGAQVINSPNTLIWNELRTNDLAAAAALYGAAFGWDVKSNEDPTWLNFANEGRAHTGVSLIDGDAKPYWLNFFLVDDLDAAMARAQELGGTVDEDSIDRSEWGARVAMRDPQGGVFAVFESTNGAPEPPTK